METIQMINAFENITGTEVRDCVKGGDRMYFLVNAGKAALAIGKGGQRVQTAERQFGCPIKVVEFDETIEKFIKNMIPCAEKIDIKGKKISVSINGKSRGSIIGKEGCNIKTLREILCRNSDFEDLRVL
jgi:NusA-like KH domain protein